MNIGNLVKKRISCRDFNNEFLSEKDKSALLSFISENSFGPDGEIIGLRIIEKQPGWKSMQLDYGMIQGHCTYILGINPDSKSARVNYGYVMEKIILKATELNIATCWIGYFDKFYFNELEIADGYEIPSIVIAGYPKERKRLLDKIMRFTVKASTRQPWDQLFFDSAHNTPLTPQTAGEYGEPLEMVRLAPSAGNSQPWRVFYDNNKNQFHFFKKIVTKQYEAKGLHDIDMGIAMCHFELSSIQNGLRGKWTNFSQEDTPNNLSLNYIKSWVCQ